MTLTKVKLQKKREHKKAKRKQKRKIMRYVKFVAKMALDYQTKYVQYKTVSERLLVEANKLVEKNNELLRHWNILISNKPWWKKVFLRFFQGG